MNFPVQCENNSYRRNFIIILMSAIIWLQYWHFLDSFIVNETYEKKNLGINAKLN